MYPYKVIYLESAILTKTAGQFKSGNMDALTTSKELEALLIEQKREGFELQSITPLDGTVVSSFHTINTTIGLMVTFKQLEK